MCVRLSFWRDRMRWLVAAGLVASSMTGMANAQSYDERVQRLSMLLEEIETDDESRKKLYVLHQGKLVPVSRQEFITCASSAYIEQVAMSVAGFGFGSAPNLNQDALRAVFGHKIREAVAATEALRRALRAQINRLTTQIQQRPELGPMAFDLRNAKSVEAYLKSVWRTEIRFLDAASERDFRDAIPKLRSEREGFARLILDRVNCTITSTEGNLRCAIGGSLILSEGSMGSRASPLRDGSYEIRGRNRGGTIKFSALAPEVGGVLLLHATLTVDDGSMEQGSMSWLASGAYREVATWRAIRVQ